MAENRYRKIEVRMWGDEKYRTLSPLLPSGQALWLFLLTGPHTGPIPGLFRAGRAALAEELGWAQEAFDKAFAEVFQLGIAKADWRARVVWIPNAIKCNLPQSPNVVISWACEWHLIPECDLKREAFETIKSVIYGVGEEFGKAFDKTFQKPSVKALPNQEQEQEQEQDISTFPQTAFADHRALAVDTNRSKPTEAQIEQLYSLYPRKRDKLAAKKAICKAVGIVIAGDHDHPAMPLEEALNYLAQRITLYARCVQGCDPEFIPYPASWLSAGSFWDDEGDWRSERNGVVNGNGAAKLPANYVPASERIRQERNVARGAH
ncbi:MAG TPA: hypothetical protein VN950_19185 [Terriglobales bacterium]|nr:hypothetical protein [Terriglobales bacterium]